MSKFLNRLTGYVSNVPRRLEGSDLIAFESAARNRQPPRNIEFIRNSIRTANPVRWRRMQSDLAWLRKEMRKRGMNPEEARWVL